MAANPEPVLHIPEYERAQDRAVQLAQSAVTQEELSALAQVVPNLFGRHRISVDSDGSTGLAVHGAPQALGALSRTHGVWTHRSRVPRCGAGPPAC
jgi:hypothetical protein